MGKIEVIENRAIKNSLLTSSRQYLAGDLKRPQSLKEIQDEQLEIGITKYSENESEKGHYHQSASEYHLVLSGLTQYLDVDTKEEFEFKKGDFFVIRPGTKYLQKSKKGTEILFVKYPPGNDKLLLEETELISNWLSSKIESARKDYYYKEGAPKPNSIKPAVAVVLRKNDQILLIKRKDSGNWSLPGGTHEFGESLIDTAIREIKEEVGFEISIDQIIGTYTDPNILIEYNDGEVRQEFTILYLGQIKSGNLELDDESTDGKWINKSEVLDLKMAKSQARRIKDVLSFLDSNRQFLK